MSYIGNTPGVSSQRVVLEEVITGSPKSAFTPISGYIKGYVDVLINGVEIDTADFTAADGVTVTLGTAAAVGDTVKIKTWLPRGLSDGYLKSEADAKFAPLVNGNLIMAPNAGSNRVIGFASGTDTTLVLQGGGTSGGGANLELTRDARAFLDATTTEIRSLDGSTVYGVFNSTGFGVGTSSPLAKVNASGAAGSNMFQSNDTNSTGTFLRMYGDVTNGSVINVKTGDAIRFAHSAQDFSGFTERMRIDSSGNLLLGQTSGTSKFVVQKSNPARYDSAHIEMASSSGDVILAFHAQGASAVHFRHVRNSGAVQVRNVNNDGFAPIEASAFPIGSDYRLKENIVPLNNALDRLMQLPVYRFNFKPYEVTGVNYGDETVDGFLAHEVAAVVPEAAFGEKDAVNEDDTPNYQSIDQSKLVPLLTAAIQQQQAIIEQLRTDVEALKGQP